MLYNANFQITDENGKTLFDARLNNLNAEQKDALKKLFFEWSSDVQFGDAIALIDNPS